MVEVIFKFNNTDIKIKCEKNDIMEDIFNKISSIINKPFDELYFNYNKNSVNYKITLDELIEEEKDNINNIEILVYTKEKNEMINEIYDELKQKYHNWFYEDSHKTIKYGIIYQIQIFQNILCSIIFFINYYFFILIEKIKILYYIIKRVINTDENKEDIIKEIEEEKETIELLFNEIDEEYGITGFKDEKVFKTKIKELNFDRTRIVQWIEETLLNFDHTRILQWLEGTLLNI